MKQTRAKTTTNKDLKANFNDITAYLEDFFTKKAPSIPGNAKEVIVKFAPIITIIILILALPPILAVIGIGALFTPFAFLSGPTAGLGLSLGIILLIVTLILEAMAIPGLMARKLKGWNLVYYASWLGALQSLLSGNIIGGLLSFAISMWVLFQVKSYYK